MLLIQDPYNLQQKIADNNHKRRPVHFVPTMGALHEGHLALISEANKGDVYLVVSIFVNPLQFNNSNDLGNYPRDLERDLHLLENIGVDLVFAPDTDQMYPGIPTVSIQFGAMETVLEGAYRPGHFQGVGLVVAKLFNLIHPTRSFFGLKDLQQFSIIKKLVEDLSFDIELVGVPTVRASSGLALSSRNSRLSTLGLEQAATINAGLELAARRIRNREDAETILSDLRDFYAQSNGFTLEYCEMIDPDTFAIQSSYSDLKTVAICVAGYVEGVRLIDNLYLRLVS